MQRHAAATHRLDAAVVGFPARIGCRVELMRHTGPEDRSGWLAVAEAFLDYLGARSARDPALRGKDAQTALDSAAAAAVGAVELRATRGAPLTVHIGYLGAGVSYNACLPRPLPLGAADAWDEDDDENDEDEDDEDEGLLRGDTTWAARHDPTGSQDWLQALYLAILAGRESRAADAFVRTFPARAAAGERRPEIGTAHALLGYVFRFHDRRPLSAPPTRAEVAAEAESVLARCAPAGPAGPAGPGAGPQHAALAAVVELVADRPDGFAAALAALLEERRRAADPSVPRHLLPLDALALAALAVRREGWPLDVDSDYLPASLVTGFAGDGPRVAAYGRDKRTRLGRGTTVVPRGGVTGSAGRFGPRFWDRETADFLAEWRDPRADERMLAMRLDRRMEDQALRFAALVAADPIGRDPRLRSALRLGAQAGAGAFRLAGAAEGERVTVSVDGHPRTLPRWRGGRRLGSAEWTQAVALALAAGEREPLAGLVTVAPGFFPEGEASTVAGSYRAALHDYLRGADPEPATDRALAVREAAARRGVGPLPPVVLLSQLVAADHEGFALALVDALEEHRDHYSVGDRAAAPWSSVGLDILGLARHAARLQGRPVPVRSRYLPPP
ncbi:hypothetical protein BIV57_17260 [Mangrovactinospora gilvigrisea]|uniref:Uncharacterized protein n=1 Tax=Mangrovactinospora gilvigrisea TaxID=1428644 RepID=A0A1J7BS05_9ACTN|nr:immunity 49 family protein [Mangrovactinospora gilvigrisea]OIV36241.1 hypothetical protein BIV57_17260 [Mangrovactinospora gilvigrisea]